MKATWKHHEDNKFLDAKERNELPASVYAFPDKRKEPLNNASHVRNAIARFDQVKDVTDHDSSAAKSFGDWHKRLVSITGWNGKIQTQHVYRVVHVGSFGTVNLFEQLRIMVGQKDMVNQTLIVIPRPSSKGGGYYIVNSQESLRGLSLKGSNTCDPLLLIQDG